MWTNCATVNLTMFEKRMVVPIVTACIANEDAAINAPIDMQQEQSTATSVLHSQTHISMQCDTINAAMTRSCPRIDCEQTQA